jgi:hypothetical protein
VPLEAALSAEARRDEADRPLWALAADARAKRSGWLVALASGMVGIADVLAAAAGTDGRALRQLALADVLYAAMRFKYPASPSYARRASRAILAEVLSRTGAPGARGVKLSWLLSSRSGGRRIDALAEALGRDNRKPPSERWPY